MELINGEDLQHLPHVVDVESRVDARQQGFLAIARRQDMVTWNSILLSVLSKGIKFVIDRTIALVWRVILLSGWTEAGCVHYWSSHTPMVRRS